VPQAGQTTRPRSWPGVVAQAISSMTRNIPATKVQVKCMAYFLLVRPCRRVELENIMRWGRPAVNFYHTSHMTLLHNDIRFDIYMFSTLPSRVLKICFIRDKFMSTLNLPITTDTFEHYMVQINRFDLLSAEEEYNLAIRHLENDDMEAAHRLICANLRFVVKVANEYRGYGLRLLDLVQEGNIGLMMAVKKFDPARGTRLITYAVWWIRAYIQNYVMRSWSLVKIGTTQMQKKLFFKLAQTRNALRNLTGTEQIEEIAHELDVNEEVVTEMSQRMGGRDTSLDVELTEGEGYTLLNTLADESDNQEELLLAHEEQRLNSERTSAALATLKPRERQIIERRILAEVPSTLQDLADELDISRERVRQIEQNALRKLRTAISLPLD